MVSALGAPSLNSSLPMRVSMLSGVTQDWRNVGGLRDCRYRDNKKRRCRKEHRQRVEPIVIKFHES
jgi:hypothetical protein